MRRDSCFVFFRITFPNRLQVSLRLKSEFDPFPVNLFAGRAYSVPAKRVFHPCTTQKTTRVLRILSTTVTAVTRAVSVLARWSGQAFDHPADFFFNIRYHNNRITFGVAKTGIFFTIENQTSIIIFAICFHGFSIIRPYKLQRLP